jgi:hypothetical protein
MRNVAMMLFALFALALTGFTGAEAQILTSGDPDVDGTWEITWETPDGRRTMLVSVEKAGMELQGTARMESPAEAETAPAPLFDTGIDGDRFLFKVTPAMDEDPTPMVFYGVIGGGVMGGYLTGSQVLPESEVPFVGYRRSTG